MVAAPPPQTLDSTWESFLCPGQVQRQNQTVREGAGTALFFLAAPLPRLTLKPARWEGGWRGRQPETPKKSSSAFLA